MEPDALRQHARQERLDEPVHGADVEVEGEVPRLVVALQDGAVVDVARGVAQDVDGADLLREVLHLLVREHVELAALGAGDAFQLGDVEIRRPHRRALGDVCLRDRAPDALSGRGDDRDLALQTPRHAVSPCPVMFHGSSAVLTMCASRRSASSLDTFDPEAVPAIPGDVVGEQLRRCSSRRVVLPCSRARSRASGQETAAMPGALEPRDRRRCSQM